MVNDKLFATNTNDIVINASGSGDVERQQNMDDTLENQKSKEESPDAGSSLNVNNRNDKDAGEVMNAQVPSWVWLAIPLAIVLLVSAVIGVRKYLRRRKLNRMKALPPSERTSALFLFFMDAFKKMKLPQPGSNTLREYQDSARGALCRFEQTTGNPAFNEVLSVYSLCAYGPLALSEEEADVCVRYYEDFHRRARKQVGIFKYIPLFFRI